MVVKVKISIKKIIITPLIIALLLFSILEVTLRIYRAVNPAFMITPDTTYMRYRGNPYADELNGFKLNSRGYKDVEFNEIKNPGRYRILAIGDSQTYGAVPYPDSYMTLVEKNVQRTYPHCEILNMGIPTAGPVDYVSILINEGLDLNPDMVLLNFNIYDDFKNGGKRFKLYSYSAAAAFINCSIANRVRPQGLVFGAGIYREGFSLRSYKSYIRLVIDAHGGVFQKSNASFNNDFQSSFSYMETIKKICDKKKIALAVVIIPADLQLYPHLQKNVLETLHAQKDDFDFQIPNRMLVREFDRLHIQHLDILGKFQNRYSRDGTSFTQGNDPHWNKHGCRVAAETVSFWLIQQIDRQLHPTE